MTQPAPLAETVAAIDAHGTRVQGMFTDIARGYDRANRWMSLGIDALWRRRAVAEVLPEGTGEAGARPRILDLCAGTLDSTLELHRRYPEADIVGGDFSAGMLAVGEAKLQGAARARIVARQMDAHALPEPDATFDAVFCAFGARNLSDLEAATREQLRVLRPGGRLTVLEFFRPRGLFSRAFHACYNRTVLPVVGWAATGNLGAYLYLPRSIGAFVTIEDYCALLERAGLRVIGRERLFGGVAGIVRAERPRGGA
ncbi:ubiquinone/menaquinone biosynthesis methyltransferase [Nannocystis punicea]|uniref:Demethylmenaquinone methyltransferase n=1 Tax=Nannocystis punicea TaxID=2995304 RepID=A0ABY7HHS3_9BACT|nr:ubiquinone/menaquinone biosynthesis methyltransferase [Nannocystis poenicansa]WAS98643.1 ubiquinone/menaquinone biosynthesis methyltransferase [Nannocystis poenicansa]